MKKRIPMAILAIIILTALDQLVKHLISTNFQVGQTRKIIDLVRSRGLGDVYKRQVRSFSCLR